MILCEHRHVFLYFISILDNLIMFFVVRVLSFNWLKFLWFDHVIELTNIFMVFHAIVLLTCVFLCTMMHYDCNSSINISFHNSLTYVFMVHLYIWLTFSWFMCFNMRSSRYVLLAWMADWNGRASFLMATLVFLCVSTAELQQKNLQHITILLITHPCTIHRECPTCNSKWNTIL